MRVAVGIGLGFNPCEPHTHLCGELVDARGLHSFVCNSAPGRTARHHTLNDIIYSHLLAFQPQRNQSASLILTEMAWGLTLGPWCAGKPFLHGMKRLSALWRTRIWTGRLGLQLSCQQLEKSTTIQSCCNLISSNQLLLKMLAFSTALPLFFSMHLAVASVHLVAKNAKVFFFFNEFLSACNVSTPFFYITVLFAMIRTSSHSSCVAFNSRDQYYQGWNK